MKQLNPHIESGRPVGPRSSGRILRVHSMCTLKDKRIWQKSQVFQLPSPPSTPPLSNSTLHTSLAATQTAFHRSAPDPVEDRRQRRLLHRPRSDPRSGFDLDPRRWPTEIAVPSMAAAPVVSVVPTSIRPVWTDHLLRGPQVSSLIVTSEVHGNDVLSHVFTRERKQAPHL